MSDQGTPAGWYSDPAGSGEVRWWDGVRWTDSLRAQPPALDSLPPPSLADAAPPRRAVPNAAAPHAGGTAHDHGGPDEREPRPGQDGSADPSDRDGGRSRRGLLLVTASVVVMLVAAGVTYLFLTERPVAASTSTRMPDLAAAPEVVWTLDTLAFYEELIDLIDLRAPQDPWLPTGEELRADLASHLDGDDWGSGLRSWSVDDRLAVLQPTLHDVSGRLHGIDVRTGEELWTSDAFADRDDPRASVTCVVGDGLLHCLRSSWDPARDRTERQLRLVSTRDGSTVVEIELSEGTGSARLADVVEDPVVVADAAAGTSVTRYDRQGQVQWSTTLPGSTVGDTTHVDGHLYVAGGVDGDAWVEVIELASGDLAPDLRPRGGDGSLTLRRWGDRLLQLEWSSDGENSRSTVAELDPTDGRERWWHTSTASVPWTSTVEPGAPVLLQQEGRVTALDPEDGSERWSYRMSQGSPMVPLADAEVVLLSDDEEVVALDATTGELRWSQRHHNDDVHARAAASLLYLEEGSLRVRALGLGDGSERWSWSGGGEGYLATLGDRVVTMRPDRVEGLG